ncbi:MAG: TIGR04282 family arsenosugar biosynthesis glycosyltransferase [Betaproteobacteria bacterium]
MTARSDLPALLVFAKEPVPGQVKTRLAAAVGDERAAAVYRELTAVTLAQAAQARCAGIVGRLELWCAPDTRSPYFAALAAAHGATLHRQGDGDLGSRMAAAITDALTRAPAVLLVGTDCPTIDGDYLARARAALTSHDAVIGPADDGGYVLIGATCPLSFSAVRWSTAHARGDTIAAFERAGRCWASLPERWDVDDAAGLARWEAQRAAAASARA